MELQTLRYEVTERVALITLNRPKALNAMNRIMLQELAPVLDQAEQDPDVRVVVLTGAAEKAFAAGADITEFQQMSPLEALHSSQAFQALFNRIERLKKPVIAAVNGFCLGAGCELALACDLIFASDRARFGQPEINLGFIPGGGGTQRLSRLIGKPRAKELIYTGEIIDAQEAYRIGLANKVFPADELIPAVRKFAQQVIGKGAVALEVAKKVIDEGHEAELTSGLALEAQAFALCFGTEDRTEGIAAFLEKRQPHFKGR
ncbi:MAG: enoyl-CoA hydratase/isomerase family protein [Candidatus Methylomirabilales bacterium]